MREGVYSSVTKCPVCEHKFDVFRVKTGYALVSNHDTDFCIHYKDINPLWYDIWICEKCGYAEEQHKFNQITNLEKGLIKNEITSKWTRRSYLEKRDLEKVVEMFKLAYLNHHVRKSHDSDKARICIRLAWLYRSKGDEREFEYLRMAARHYKATYSNEKFPVGKLDEVTCMYIIGELYRRLREFNESLDWFQRLIINVEFKKNAKVYEMAKDQCDLTKKEKEEFERKELKETK